MEFLRKKEIYSHQKKNVNIARKGKGENILVSRENCKAICEKGKPEKNSLRETRDRAKGFNEEGPLNILDWGFFKGGGKIPGMRGGGRKLTQRRERVKRRRKKIFPNQNKPPVANKWKSTGEGEGGRSSTFRPIKSGKEKVMRRQTCFPGGSS